MSRRGRFGVVAVAALVPVLLVVPPARAYDPITWFTCDGGGTAAAVSGGYSLGGTIGQVDAGTLTGGAWTLAGGFWGGGRAPVTAVSDESPVPGLTLRFEAPSPNPVHFRSRIAFELPVDSETHLTIFDVAGHAVRTVDFGYLTAGRYQKDWNAVDRSGRPLAAGVYFLRLEAAGKRGIRKALVLR
jgi:FlgD Ig-like domain